MTSWRTTILGIIAGLTILLSQAKAILDDDPNTQPNVEEIIAALGIMGLGVVARDGNKSSQDHGLRK